MIFFAKVKMNCPRCNAKLQNVIEYFETADKFIYTKEFYCTKCKGSVTEKFDQRGLLSSEWIDFNV